jgi:predicted nuclease of predicted toxin-antitoxin system
MTIWVDAHLSPAIAIWIVSTFGIRALALRDLGLRHAEDPEIFEAAKAQGDRLGKSHQGEIVKF